VRFNFEIFIARVFYILLFMNFDSIKSTSIFDIIYNAYNNHYDIVLSLDSVISQFFSIFQVCEKERVFGDITSKKNIIVPVQYTMTKKELEDLPHNFIGNIDLSVFGLEQYTDSFKRIMGQFSTGVVIFALSGMSERLEYTAHTYCKIPEIKIDAEDKKVREILGLMYLFLKIPTRDEMNYSQRNKHNMIIKYVELIRKIYDAQFQNKKDEEYFYNLIQKNNGSGGPVTGTITFMESAPSYVQLNVKRTFGESSTNPSKRFPDLIYQSKLITRQKVGILTLNVVSKTPIKDTTC
jgi:hypothetical protein